MPDITEYLEAAAAFTKATGIAVEHGWTWDNAHDRWGLDDPLKISVHIRPPDAATDRDLAVWCWAMVVAIYDWTGENRDRSDDRCHATMVGLYHGTANSVLLCFAEEVSTRYDASGTVLRSALLAAAKKIGGIE